MGWKMAIFHLLIFHRPVGVAHQLKSDHPFFNDSPHGR